MSEKETKQAAKAEKAEAKTAKKPAKRAAAKKADAEAKPAEKKPAKKAESRAPKKSAKKADDAVKKQGKLIDDIRLYDVIERPIITEKSTYAAEQNKVVFAVNPTATKKDIKAAIEQLFAVKVEKVNTIKTPGKVKRFRGRVGQRSDQRKAIVTLKQGQSIDVAAGLK